MKQGGKETHREGFMNYSDYELIYMIKEDEETFGYLVSKYEPLFKKLTYSFYCSNKHKGIDQEELLQVCRLVLYEISKKYDQDKDILFYSYLLFCLKRALSQYVKKNSKALDCYNYMDYNNYENLCITTTDYGYYEDIMEFKNNLDYPDSCVFELKINGFSYKEISILLDVSIKKVDNILVKIRKKIEKNFLFS